MSETNKNSEQVDIPSRILDARKRPQGGYELLIDDKTKAQDVAATLEHLAVDREAADIMFYNLLTIAVEQKKALSGKYIDFTDKIEDRDFSGGSSTTTMHFPRNEHTAREVSLRLLHTFGKEKGYDNMHVLTNLLIDRGYLEGEIAIIPGPDEIPQKAVEVIYSTDDDVALQALIAGTYDPPAPIDIVDRI